MVLKEIECFSVSELMACPKEDCYCPGLFATPVPEPITGKGNGILHGLAVRTLAYLPRLTSNLFGHHLRPYLKSQIVAPLQTVWITICTFTKSPGDLYAHWRCSQQKVNSPYIIWEFTCPLPPLLVECIFLLMLICFSVHILSLPPYLGPQDRLQWLMDSVHFCKMGAVLFTV